MKNDPPVNRPHWQWVQKAKSQLPPDLVRALLGMGIAGAAPRVGSGLAFGTVLNALRGNPAAAGMPPMPEQGTMEFLDWERRYGQQYRELQKHSAVPRGSAAQQPAQSNPPKGVYWSEGNLIDPFQRPEFRGE